MFMNNNVLHKYFFVVFHNTYNHDKSSEYKEDGRKFQTPEGTYTLKGFFSYDNISVSTLILI